jgi:hypothetical protein
MTSKQKQEKLAVITALITAAGFEPDRYGNYKTELSGTSYRIKLKKINIRIEAKQPGSTIWHKIISQPIVAIDLTKLSTFISRFINQPEA